MAVSLPRVPLCLEAHVEEGELEVVVLVLVVPVVAPPEEEVSVERSVPQGSLVPVTEKAEFDRNRRA